MIRPGITWCLARAEARLTRRLVRYWIFVTAATVMAAVSWGWFFFIHRMFSWGSASAATANPRFFLSNFGGGFLFIFFLGLIFLGFEIRARDKRERIVEVLDVTPCSNLELVMGRALGILIMAWVPIVIVLLLLSLVSWLVNVPIEPYSVGIFVFLGAIPAYVFATGLIFLTTLLTRHRLVAAISSLVVIVGAFFASLWWVRVFMTPFTDIGGGYTMVFASDILPGLHGFVDPVQRLGFLLGGLGLLVIAAAVHPRQDDGSRAARGAAGAALLVLGGVVCGALVLAKVSDFKQQQQWLAAHEARQNDPAPDLLALTGELRVDPGRKLDANLELRLRAPDGTGLDSALFTLNPGMNVLEVNGALGRPLSFTHDQGLLDVALPAALAPGEETTLRLVLEGEPDPNFAYFDAALDPMRLRPVEAQIVVLGIDPLIFDKRYVALMPGARWLPASGSEVGRGDPEVRAADFFRLDLTVDLPEGWLAAGPGRRQDPVAPAGDGRVRYRYAPPAPLPEVALIAGRFETRSTEVDDVLLEVLISPKHVANFDFFEEAAGEIGEWLAERLREADQAGLPYPYDALTLVEVPTSLRGFAGGWRMDSTLIQPAMILMRENAFPTANFEGGRRRFERARDNEGGAPRAMRRALEAHFENDINGGNPFIAAARSFFGYQTAGAGPEGLPLDYVWEQLSAELVTEHRGFFTVHFFDNDFGQDFALAGQAMQDPNRVSDSYSEVLIHRITSTNKVWDTVTGVSLTELDPRQDPERALNVLALKGGAMAQSILDDLGREKAGQFLGALRNRRLGQSYTREDVVAAGEQVGEDLESWLALWIDETDLPGFTLSDVRYHRLEDADDGSPNYQLLITVRNGEQPAGLVKLEYRTESQRAASRRQAADPIKISGQSAMEIGLVISEPLRSARIVPYLAHNRDPFNVSLPPLDEERIVADEPFAGGRPVEWTPRESNAIVVDDLDGPCEETTNCFTVEETGTGSRLRVAASGREDEDLDQGLPVSRGDRGSTNRWSRMTYPDAFGKYRHTMALVSSGKGAKLASFRAAIPRAGQWELEFHLPAKSTRGSLSRDRGNWKLTIEDSSGSQEVSFNAEGGDPGWNSVGIFEIADGEVHVRVSDETDGGQYVLADAIRWVPAEGGGDVAQR